MKIKTTGIFLPVVAGLLVMFSSCQKEIHIDLSNRGGGTDDSTLLDKLILLDTTALAPNDTVYYLKIVYDGYKRANKVFRVEYNGSVIDTVFTYTYFYTGSDTLPFRVYITDDVSSSTQVYFFYDNSGKVIVDSTIETYLGSITNSRVERFIYQAGSVKRNIKTVDNQGNVDNYSTILYQSRSGGNILTQSDTTFLSVPAYAVNLNYQYDSHPNPLKIMFPGVYPYYEGEETLDENTSDNNFRETYTERKEINPTSVIDIDHYVYSYIYGTDGLPKIAWEREVDNGTVDKYIYLYTK